MYVLLGSDVVRHLPQKIFRINRSGSWNIIGHVFTTRQISQRLYYCDNMQLQK